ncbi:hypothetical protein [Galactobacter caseinivorans]|uniref:Uncharacterized protein n=1 Tax=Galactobacter caseinivorans TaxID=2676123 RepID=A0A496PMB4_9MICC|nr:hypothetical protein [Galactobacter caseinivorans]RKW71681.1 hypothetical protein DWQ67_02280 [Galactobacter caseinivorans]
MESWEQSEDPELRGQLAAIVVGVEDLELLELLEQLEQLEPLEVAQDQDDGVWVSPSEPRGTP